MPAANVPTITLNNGVAIPQLGFGVWQVPEDDAEPVVAKALEVGYRSIDTAAAYGNEEGTGAGIAASGIPRDEVFVTTKLWNNAHGYDPTVRAFDESMTKLGLDYLDLYLIHWPVPAKDAYLDTWRAFETLYADGRIRAIGVANFLPEHLDRLVAESAVVPAVNQIELHPGHLAVDADAANRRHGVITEAWSPLGRGQALTNPYILAIAERNGATAAQVIIAWHLQRGRIVIPKSVTPARIQENFESLGVTLSEADLAEIDSLDQGEAGRIGPNPHTFNVGA